VFVRVLYNKNNSNLLNGCQQLVRQLLYKNKNLG